MPIHDWTKIFDGAFHDFHQAWVFSIKSSLNKGLLPPGYYASMEQVVSGPNADVVTLDRWQAATGKTSSKREQDAGGIAVADCPPRAKYQYDADRSQCAEDSDLLGDSPCQRSSTHGRNQSFRRQMTTCSSVRFAGSLDQPVRWNQRFVCVGRHPASGTMACDPDGLRAMSMPGQ